MVKDLWLALLSVAHKQEPLHARRALLNECDPAQVQQARDLGVLGAPELAGSVIDPRYGDGLLEVEFSDEGPQLCTPSECPEDRVAVRRDRLEQYPVSLDALFRALGETNRLLGKPRRLECGLWLLGRHKSGARSTHVCLLPRGVRGSVRLLILEAHQELGQAAMIVLLPPRHVLDAAAASDLRSKDILPLALQDRLGPGLQLDLAEVQTLTVGDEAGEALLHVDVASATASFGGAPLKLRATALRVLDFLASRPQKYFSAAMVAAELDDDPALPDKWMADRVYEIRSALDAALGETGVHSPPPTELVRNRRNHGYALMLAPAQIWRA